MTNGHDNPVYKVHKNVDVRYTRQNTVMGTTNSGYTPLWTEGGIELIVFFYFDICLFYTNYIIFIFFQKCHKMKTSD